MSGRGQKGQTSRSGVSINGFEGGQTPIHRRLPKRGFNNYTRRVYETVNLSDVQKAVDAGKLDAKKNIKTPEKACSKINKRENKLQTELDFRKFMLPFTDR